MSFPCPGCGGRVDQSPERGVLRCPACRAVLRARVAAAERAPAWDVEVVGAPQTRRRVEPAWGESDERRLRRWLVWASAVTLGMALALYLLVRLLS